MRIYINPTYSPTEQTEGGIRRVVEAQTRLLPEHGFQIVHRPEDAELIVNHGTLQERRPGIPTVAACHGLYWHGYDWPAWATEANQAVIDNMRGAALITTPSRWVAHAVERALWRPVFPVYHGVDTHEWTPGEPQGYVLWNKARTDAVSNEKDFDEIADRLPRRAFASTFGRAGENRRIVGHQPLHVMKQLVQNASVYLATARETFGIGTIEALAAGVPVVGWRYGGQEEIIIEGETGYLVEYGDYDGLAEAVERAFADRTHLGAAARADAVARWQWDDKIAEYARLYRLVPSFAQGSKRVTVIITCYNLGMYLNSALDSVVEQTMHGSDFDVLVVDDNSTDTSYETAVQLRAYYERKGASPEISVHKTPQNLGLSGARNWGAAQARGRYLLFLDADDMLERNALAALADYLDEHPLTDIAFGMLDTVDEQGGNRARNPWPKGTFDWTHQIAHLNQLPYASMMRRRVWANTGGYRTRDWRAEDASFWLRASSFGYHIACATHDTVLVYRIRQDSKSGQERSQHPDADGDWTSWFPWRLGASSGQEGAELVRDRPRPNASLVPAGAQGTPPAPLRSWPVRHFQAPIVSVIIPVGRGHAQYLIDALDSVQGQTCPEWEVVVVNDSGTALTELPPWARQTTTPQVGAGGARNAGVAVARASLVVFLDADDVLHPQALEKMLAQWATTGGYVYSDTLMIDVGGRTADVWSYDWRRIPQVGQGGTVNEPYTVIQSGDWDQKTFLSSGYGIYPGQHSVTALVAKVDVQGVGGFDTSMEAWEDWEFYLRLAASGITGHRIAEPLLAYRLMTGERRRGASKHRERLIARMRERYHPFVTGEKPMCSCGSGGASPALRQAVLNTLGSMLPPDLSLPEMQAGNGNIILPDGATVVRLEFIGDQYGAVTYRGNVTRRAYRAGRDPSAQFIDVAPEDVQHLLLSGNFRVVGDPVTG